MGDRQTVADSKRRFYSAYPRVIPGLYRRVVDELLVELHLLSGQAGFSADALFALGLTQVFDNFMQGLQPEERRGELLSALCSANDMDASALRGAANHLRESLTPMAKRRSSPGSSSREKELRRCCARCFSTRLAVTFTTPDSMPWV